MKRKVVKVNLRKESQTFDGWLKYEVEVKNPDGTIDKIPAYGKDLQDALSRATHDELVVELEDKTKHIPNAVWFAIWFGYMLMLSLITESVEKGVKPFFIITGLSLMAGLTLLIVRWLRKRNISK